MLKSKQERKQHQFFERNDLKLQVLQLNIVKTIHLL